MYLSDAGNFCLVDRERSGVHHLDDVCADKAKRRQVLAEIRTGDQNKLLHASLAGGGGCAPHRDNAHQAVVVVRMRVLALESRQSEFKQMKNQIEIKLKLKLKLKIKLK